jgi:5-methylcytosine-specific restriction endonuclease McrA
MSRVHRLLRLVADTDARAVRGEDGTWVVPCLHCQSKLVLAPSGAPRGPATLEHIVPRSWFGRAAARQLVARVGTADATANLAVACARCNQQKGKTHDADGPSNPRAREVVAALLDTRAERLGTPRAELVSGDSPPV